MGERLGDGHYAIVIAIEGDRVVLEDPSTLGSRAVLDRRELEQRWHDEDNGRKHIRTGIVFRGKQPAPPPARDGSATIGTRVPELSAAKKSSKPRRKDKITERRRAGIPESEAAIAGTLKAALQQFALAAAGGYRGRDAHLPFTAHLLECFGRKEGRPDGAEIPRRFSIADAGRRVEREVALWWTERRAMMDVGFSTDCIEPPKVES